MKDEDLTGGQWRSTGSWWPGKIQLPERLIYLTLSFFFFFRKIEAKQNKSYRMQNTSTSRSTDFRRQKTITSKTPLPLYWRGFCASDRTPTTTGSPAGPQSYQNVWVLPPKHFKKKLFSWKNVIILCVCVYACVCVFACFVFVCMCVCVFVFVCVCRVCASVRSLLIYAYACVIVGVV